MWETSSRAELLHHFQAHIRLFKGHFFHSLCKCMLSFSKHFVNGGPNEEFPNPMSATDGGKTPKPFRPPKKRQRCDNLETKKESSGITNMSAKAIPTKYRDIPCEDHFIPTEEVIGVCNNSEFEVERLRKMVSSQAETIEHLRKQLRMSDLKHTRVTPESINDSKIPNYFEYCTGFTFEQFNNLCTLLRVPSDRAIPQRVVPLTYKEETLDTINLPIRSQFLLALMKLRNNYDMKDLAFKFGISVESVSVIFNACINDMFHRLGEISIWPHRDFISANMPENFKKDFPTTFAILACTELKIERPTSLQLQNQSYSDYKSANSLKGLIACDPRGSVIFVSPLFTGSISDRDIFKHCYITKQLTRLIQDGYLEPGDGIMADKGLLIGKDIEKIGLHLNIPPFAKANAQMPASDVERTKTFAKHRVHVERCIAKIKKFKIVSGRIPNSMLGNINRIWFVVSLLSNFQSHVLIDDLSHST
ncbi:uncharacterized protein LOC118216299 isoform X2 [Anguilla anguilla]|uniref:uncharacterized protein LOC118216299 isoform X2 n=1 Tax=Anguilla anguilla TaxID=7936 RepID=UPI0015B0AA17|nr:uncharacterized protein LOC118216299 isoform X2 [Anguilla anguilla]